MRGLGRTAGATPWVLLTAALCLAYAAEPSVGTFTDNRDGKTYKTVMIGRQTWMAENLNYRTDSSWCYGDDDSDNYWHYGDGNSNCDEYGRLYDWETAKTACPFGWYLPSRQDWGNLWLAVGGRSFFDSWSVTSKKLKAKAAWENYRGKSGNGTDDYGFSALPGGGRYIDGNFYKAGFFGNWWDATEYDTADAYFWRMYHNENFVQERTISKNCGLSVRCVQGLGGGSNRKGAPRRIYYSRFGFDGAIEDLLFGLMGGGDSGSLESENKSHPGVDPTPIDGSGLRGGRSRESVQRVLMQNMAAFRYAYNKRLREKPGLFGRINVKFAIDEYGSVIFAQLLESTMSDSVLEETVADKVKSLKFEKIDKSGDVTEVIFPFVFSQ